MNEMAEPLPAALARLSRDPSVVWVVEPAHDTIIVRTYGPGAREDEFSRAEERMLSRAERLQRLPPPVEFALPDPNTGTTLSVRQHSELSPDGDLRIDRYDVVDGQGVPVLSRRQEVNTPFRHEPATLLSMAITSTHEPYVYRRLTRPQRIAHWARWLHHGRRVAGENGQDEDIAFGPDVWQRMTGLDPDVESLLPDVLGDLAAMEQRDPAAMTAAFRTRCGLDG